MKNHSGLDLVQSMAAPDTRAASGASTPELPGTARVSAPHDVRVNRRVFGIGPEIIGGALDVERMVLALYQGELVTLRYQWIALPPVDLFVVFGGADDLDEYWVCDDHTWRRGDQKLNCDQLLERLVDHSHHGLLIVLAAWSTQTRDTGREIASDAVVLP